MRSVVITMFCSAKNVKIQQVSRKCVYCIDISLPLYLLHLTFKDVSSTRNPTHVTQEPESVQPRFSKNRQKDGWGEM